MLNRKKTKKEVVYDEKIAPLMQRILETCIEHDIGMFFHAYIDGPEDKHLSSTSIIPDSSPFTSPTNSVLKRLNDIVMVRKMPLSDQVQMEKSGFIGLFNPEFMDADKMNEVMRKFEAPK